MFAPLSVLSGWVWLKLIFLLKSRKYLNVYYSMFVMTKCHCGNTYKINKLVLSKYEILYCQYDMISCPV